jgi:hypothetical protein
MSDKVFDLLGASAPFDKENENALLYAPLIGSWNIDCAWYKPDGETKTAKGEWHFAWILGGRGVQDVLFPVGAAPDRYGTTLRCYDHTTGTWHVTWTQPSSGEFANMIGHKEGDRIVQEGRGTDPTKLERWCFSEITANSFLWTGEASFDDGKNWIFEQEMRGSRK